MIVVTGLMRSGTSATARLLHQHGVTMGTSTLLPMPGTTWPVEWEDTELNQILVRALQGHSADLRAEMAAYFRKRSQQQKVLRMAGASLMDDWGIKSPLLALFMDEVLWACVEVFGGCPAGPQIVCWRDYDETVESIERLGRDIPRAAHFVPWMLHHQEQIAKTLEGVPEKSRYWMEDLRRDPEGVWLRAQAQTGVRIEPEDE